jgi:hypothetical protein
MIIGVKKNKNTDNTQIFSVILQHLVEIITPPEKVNIFWQQKKRYNFSGNFL